jgi:hypothetical protein
MGIAVDSDSEGMSMGSILMGLSGSKDAETDV